jgi:ubiquitin fusion degradation protein 1
VSRPSVTRAPNSPFLALPSPRRLPQQFFGGGRSYFEEQYRCYSVAALGKPELEYGDKIVLPGSALQQLQHLEVSYPMLFRLEAIRAGLKTHVGVVEFTADEGKAHAPYWVMQQLGLAEGAFVSVRNLQLPTARFVKIRPQTSDFLRLSNHKLFLEKQLSRFSCLTKGTSICVFHPELNKNFLIDVLEVKPADACCCIETDLTVDFAAPADYVEPQPRAMGEAKWADDGDDAMGAAAPKRARSAPSGAGAGAGAGSYSSASTSSSSVPLPSDAGLAGAGSPAGSPPARPFAPKVIPFAGSGNRLGGTVGGAAAASSSAGPSGSPPPQRSPMLSGGGVVLGGGFVLGGGAPGSGGGGGAGSGGKPRTLNRFEEAKRAKAFSGAGHSLKE